MVNLKGSYLAELIHELTNMEIDNSNITRHGYFVDDEDVDIKAIRLSRYASVVEDASSYNTYARTLVQQSLTELSFMSNRECEQVLKRFDLIAERFTNAWELYFKHYQRFYEGKFSSLDFEWTFFRLFNIPVRRSGAMDVPNFGSLKTTDDFWSDLHDALMYKQGMLLELTHELREVYGIAQPSDDVEVNVKNESTSNQEIPRELSEQERSIIWEILAPLGGFNPTGLRIMPTTDFNRLIEYSQYLVLNNSISDNIQLIQQIGISTGHIRFTFYRLHERLFTTKKIRPVFIDFLHSVFRQFETYDIETTRKNFSVRPPSYFTDFNIIQ